MNVSYGEDDRMWPLYIFGVIWIANVQIEPPPQSSNERIDTKLMASAKAVADASRANLNQIGGEYMNT